MISIITAVSQNDIIGKKGPEPLLWRIPEELALFKKVTNGSVIVMGRNTMLTLREPLPNRTNVVLSRTLAAGKTDKGFLVFNSIADIVRDYPSFFVIGGEEIYRQFIEIADQVIMTTLGITIEAEEPQAFAVFPVDKLEAQYYLAYESKVMIDRDKISDQDVEYIVTRWFREISKLH